eukprot:TCONS_00027963-protein
MTSDILKSKLFNKLLGKWINLRAYAFVKVWMQQFKMDQRRLGEEVAEQGEPALRKGLKKKTARKVDRTLISPKTSSKVKTAKDKTLKSSVAASKLKKAKNTLKNKK